MKIRVYYHDTDCGGVVYYGNYMKFFEEARTEYLEAYGLSIKNLMEKGLWFIVAKQEAEYKYPCFYGDELDVSSEVIDLSPIRVVIRNVITNQNGRLTTIGKTTLVCVTKEGSPTAMPQEFYDRIKSVKVTDQKI